MSPQPPAGSLIERLDDFEGDRLAWPVPSYGLGRYVFAVFFVPHVCGWVFAIVQTFYSLLMGANLMLLGWLAAWTFAGIWVPLGLWLLLRPSRPESVLLTVYDFTHDPGWSAPAYFQGLKAGPQAWLPRKPVTVPKAEVVFALRGGQLSFEHEGKRVDIGTILREPDREWLFGVLENWRQGQAIG